MPGVIDEAYVEIIPKVDGFTSKARAGVEAGLGQINQSVNRSTQKISSAFTAAGTRSNTALNSVSRGVKKVERDAETSSGRIKRFFTDAFSEAGGSFTRLVAGAYVFVKIKDFITGSYHAASDLNETVSKTATVFGPASSSVFEFAKTSATSLGQSRRQALEAAASFGAMLEGLRIAPQRAAPMSIALDKLASDFASFHNTNPADVIEALTAAFRGEYDPVQRYVATISAATVQQRAMRDTGITNANALTMQQKALATYELLLEGAGVAQGDFARTSSGAANQSRILAAQWANLQARIGNFFLPVMALALRGVNALVGGMIRLSDSIGHVVGPMVSVFHDLNGVFSTLGQHKATLIGLAAGIVTFVVAAKAIAGATILFRALFGRGGVLDGARLRLMYAADGVRNLGTTMSTASIAAGAMNVVLLAVSIGVMIWAKRNAEARQRAEEHKAAVQELAAALNESKGAIDRNVRAMIAQRLEQSGALRQAQQLGLSLEQVTEAVSGNQDAYDAVVGSLQTMQRQLDETDTHNRGALRGVGGLTTAQREQKNAVDALLTSITGQDSALRDAIASNQRLASATDTSTNSTNTNTTAMHKAAAAARAEKEKLDALWDALTRVANANLDAADADVQYHLSLIDVDRSLKDLTPKQRAATRSLGLNTEEGLKARSEMIQRVKGIIDLGQKLKDSGKSEQQSQRITQSNIQTLRAHYLALGYNKDQIDAVISSLRALGKSPPAIAHVKVDDAEAKRRIANMNRLLNALDGKTVKTFIYNFTTNITKSAGGGAIGGQTGGMIGRLHRRPGPEDTMPIWASPREALLSERAVAAIGGPAGVDRLNRDGRVATLTGSTHLSGAPITIMPGAVQVRVEGGGAGTTDAQAIHDAVMVALRELLIELKTGARR